MANWGSIAEGVTVQDTTLFMTYNPPVQPGMEAKYTGVSVASYVASKLTLDTIPGTLSVGKITASGTPSASTFLRGDGTWSSVGTGPVSTGNGSVTIPRLQSDPDQLTAGREEFNQNTSGVPSGWTAMPSGTPDTINTNTFYSQLYMVANASASQAIKGIYQAITLLPCTIVAKLSDMSGFGTGAPWNDAGIFIAPSGVAGALQTVECSNQDGTNYGRLAVRTWTSRTVFSSAPFTGFATMAGAPPIYFKVVINSATSVDYHVSYGGFVWTKFLAATNPGFTPAAFGLFVNSGSTSVECAACFDWVQITYP